jgi:UDP-2,3-diacylglucosamine pyrophosphatase LpxH
MSSDAIVISDIHLGSDISQAKALWHFLEGLADRTKKLILNGDVFDSMDMARLKKNHWRVLSEIRHLSDKMEIIWGSGNHDKPAEVVSHLLGVKVVEEYSFVSGGSKILVLHGDRFDKFIASHPILTWISDYVYYNILQKMDKKHEWARFAKRTSKRFLQVGEIIMDKAKKYAEKHGYDIVICSHTHHAMEDISGPVLYYNTGSWTEIPCNYLEITDGHVTICDYHEPEEIH